MAKATVIVTAYNRGYVVGDALRSILAQTFGDFELLVVDDGSTDNTREVVNGIADPRLRYLRHAENRGVAAARNTGLSEARGEYVSFLDSDDLWKPAKLARDVEFLKRHAEADAVFTDVEQQFPTRYLGSLMREWPAMHALLERSGWPKETVFTQREMYLYLLREMAQLLSSMTFRAFAFAALDKFKESWRASEDWEFLLRFAKRFRFGYIDETLAIHREQKDSTYKLYNIECRMNILEMLAHEAKRASDAEARRAARAGCRDAARHLSWAYLARAERLKAFGGLVRGFAFSGDTGLLVRAAYALVRPSFERPAN